MRVQVLALSALVASLALLVPGAGAVAVADVCTPTSRPLEDAAAAGWSDEVHHLRFASDGTVAGQYVSGGPLLIWDPTGNVTAYPGAFADTTVKAMSPNRFVVGDAVTLAEHAQVGWVFRDGTFRVLTSRDSDFAAIANGVNRHGVAVGSVNQILDRGYGISRAVVWPARSTKPIALPSYPGFTHSSARFINSRGVVRGIAFNTVDGVITERISVVWRDGWVEASVEPPEFTAYDRAGKVTGGSLSSMPAVIDGVQMTRVEIPGVSRGYVLSVASNGLGAAWVQLTDGAWTGALVNTEGDSQVLEYRLYDVSASDGGTGVGEDASGEFVTTCLSSVLG